MNVRIVRSMHYNTWSGVCVFCRFVIPDNIDLGWIMPGKVGAAYPALSESTILVADCHSEELVSLAGLGAPVWNKSAPIRGHQNKPMPSRPATEKLQSPSAPPEADRREKDDRA